jgi:FG-GAP-like repeat/IPT/TIG domain/Secretion system C-terminal sorting domain
MKKQLLFMLGLLLIATIAICQPTITSFTPASGPVGTSVTITGTNFSTTAANNIVFFGATRAAVTAATVAQLTVTVPAGATYQSITVLVGGLVAYSSKPFIVTFVNGVSIDANAFATRVNLASVASPISVSIGDIDGDGKADIVSGNNSSGSISVLRNTSTAGTISYAAKVDIATGGSPQFITVGDIDGDGKPDLALINSMNASSVLVFRNTSTSGTISFATSASFTTNTAAIAIAIRDFDGDGKADLAVSKGNSSSVAVLRNTGTPGTLSFATMVEFGVGPVPYSISVGDLDGNGKADIVVANDDATVSILRNTSTVGTLSFATKVDFAVGGSPRFVSMGDIDGDGQPDLAVANSSANTVSLLRNTSTSGTISFAAKTDISTSLEPWSISLGDINGDGKIDMTVANSGSFTASAFGNTSTSGTISFAPKVDFQTNSIPQSVAMGDLDGDGKLDILSGSAGTNVSVHRNTIKISQSITFGALAAKTFGDAPFALTGTSSSGLSVSYNSSNTAVATVSGNTVTIVGGGTTTITALQAGDATYAAATNIPQTLTVNKASQTISFGALSAKVFGDAAFALTATASSGLPISYTSSNTSVATVSGSTVTIVGGGTTTITATQTGNANYNAATGVPQTLTVNKAGQTISFAPLPNKAFDDAAFNLTATASSGLSISYSSGNTTVATVSGSTVTIVGVGTTSITASQPGNANYNAATIVFQNLTIVKANQNIVFGVLAAKTFGDASFALTAGAASGLPVSYTSSNTSVATISGSTVTIVGAGTTTITASQTGDANYNAATSVPQTLTVNKADQTITFGSLANKTVGDAPFALAVTTSSGLTVSYASSNTSVATISGSTVTVLALGTTTITASQAGDSNFNPATSVQQTLSVKENQTITFGTLSDKTFGDAAFALTATSSSNLAISYTSSNTAVATVAGNSVTIVGAGAATITASQLGDANFNPAVDVDQTLTVNKANQTITFTSLTDKTIGGSAFTLSATSSSVLSVTFSTISSKITISSNQITLVSAGRATITAAQAGNTNFNAAPSVNQSFCIKPAKPTVTLSNGNTESPTLTSSATTGNQWFLNGAAITGATNATHNATQAGIYKVQATVDDCVSVFSDDQSLIVTGDISTKVSAISIYPNPVSEWLTVKLDDSQVKKSVSIHQVTGNKMISREVAEEETKFFVGDYSQGIYLVRIETGNAVKVIRFVKQ